MKLLIKELIFVATFFATWIPIVLGLVGVDMLGLDWKWWFLFVYSAFSVSVFLVYFELKARIKKLENLDTKLEREERKMNIKNALVSFEDRILKRETPLPDAVKKRLNDLDKEENV